MRDRLALALERAWRQPPRLLLLLLPLEWLFAGVTALRRRAFRRGWLRSGHPGCPVVVVGNITVGGTGKTPLVITLANGLGDAGYRVGVVSRGYGGTATAPIPVHVDSPVATVGDEALLIARSTAARVVIGRDRLAAAQQLMADPPDVILSDDGLQHYRLQRDVEVVSMDASAGFGNGHLLPVGPLREPPRRLATVDFLLQRDGQDPHSAMATKPRCFRRCDSEKTRELTQPGFGPRVHALAAIAQPQRFFSLLRELGLDPVEHPFADHRPFEIADFASLQDLPLVMTSKDAVKFPPGAHPDAWILDIDLQLPEGFVARLISRAGLAQRPTDGSDTQSSAAENQA
jgi:tetraacyldisaccharide 4'-kinase